MKHWSKYDYVIVNEDLQRAYDGARSILRAERLRRERCPAIGTFIEGMVEDLRRETDGA